MKIVYCSTVLPSGRRTGGEIATQSFVDALRTAGHEVTVLGYRRPGDSKPLGFGEIHIGDRPIETNQAGRQAYSWLVKALLTGRPYSAEKYVSKAYRREVARVLSGGDIGLIVLDHAQMGFLLSDLPDHISYVFVAHNVESDIYVSQQHEARNFLKRWLFRREAEKIDRLERALCTCSSQTWVLTQHDKTHFSSVVSNSDVVAFDMPGTEVVEGKLGPRDLKWDLGLIGTWSWEANAAGLRWFQQEVVPLLNPEIQIGVAGKGAELIVQSPANALGFVPDALEFMRSCRVMCVPSTSGGGVQIKTLDAIAAGRPLIVTSVALRGIESPPASVRVADSPQEFADAVGVAFKEACADLCEEALSWSRRRVADFAAVVNQSVRCAVERARA